MAEKLVHKTKSRYYETVTRETPFETAGDLYAALAFLTLEGVDLDKYAVPSYWIYPMKSLTLERLPDGD